jgi:hypothetical protein
MKKNKYVPVAIATAIGLTAIPILVTPNVSNNLATKTLTSSNAIDKVDISSVIQITNLNTFHQGKNVAPSIKDINNALKVLNNPLGTQTNWYPNQ